MNGRITEVQIQTVAVPGLEGRVIPRDRLEPAVKASTYCDAPAKSPQHPLLAKPPVRAIGLPLGPAADVPSGRGDELTIHGRDLPT